MAQAIALNLVINGVTYRYSFSPSEPLHAVIAEALGKSGNTGRPPSEWVATDANGAVLDPNRRAGQIGSGATVFLALSAGVGG